MAVVHKIKAFVMHPAILAAFLVVLWEWLRLDMRTYNELFKDPLSGSISVVLMYGVAYFLASILHRQMSSTEIQSEETLRHSIQELIDESSQYVYLVSPYLDPGNVLMESVLKARRRGVRVTLIHNTDQLAKAQLTEDIRSLVDGGVEVYNHPKLHSKLYVSEHKAIVCSLNLVAASYTNSFECGVVSTWRTMKNQSREYIYNTIKASGKCVPTTLDSMPPSIGYCISSGAKMTYNVYKPVEYGEYRAKAGSIVGRFCHSCGCEVQTSVSQPLCATCQDHRVGQQRS